MSVSIYRKHGLRHWQHRLHRVIVRLHFLVEEINRDGKYAGAADRLTGVLHRLDEIESDLECFHRSAVEQMNWRRLRRLKHDARRKY